MPAPHTGPPPPQRQERAVGAFVRNARRSVLQLEAAELNGTGVFVHRLGTALAMQTARNARRKGDLRRSIRGDWRGCITTARAKLEVRRASARLAGCVAQAAPSHRL